MPDLGDSSIEVGNVNNFSGKLIKLALANESVLKGFIHKNIIDKNDADDIFQDALIMLSRRNEEKMDEIKLSYVYGCIGFIIKRYRHKKKTESNYVKYLINEESLYGDNEEVYEDGELMVSQINLQYEDLDSILSELESSRYAYGYDIFELVYLKYLIKDREQFETLLKILGDGKKDMMKVYANMIKSPEVTAMLHALESVENAEELLEKYVYGSKDIKRLLS